MTEYTLEEIRRLYMIMSLFPCRTWEWKKVCYDTSAEDYRSSHRSVPALKSWWNLNHDTWTKPHIMENPPSSISRSSIPNNLLEAQQQQDQNDSTAQDPESLLVTQDQQSQQHAAVSGHLARYAGQDRNEQKAPVVEYPTSYVGQELVRAQIEQGQQDQQNASTARLPASYIYTQYPTHSAPTAPAPSFTGTTYGDPHFPNSSSGWFASPGGSVPVPAGQQPLGVASYFPAGPSPNAFVACNPNFAFTPQTARLQATESCFLGLIAEENSANHEVDAGNVNDADSDTSFEDEDGNKGEDDDEE